MSKPEYLFGENERRDEEVLKDKASKPMNLKGEVEAATFNHEEVGMEFLALFSTTKMSPAERGLMACRFMGMGIEEALMYCQRHGLLIGVRIPQAIEIENEMKLKMLISLSRMTSIEIQKKASMDGTSSSLIIPTTADHGKTMPPANKEKKDG